MVDALVALVDKIGKLVEGKRNTMYFSDLQ